MKMLGLAALAAVAAMALVGVSSASATNTVLCAVLEGSVCPEHHQIASTNPLLNEKPYLDKVHLTNSALPGGKTSPTLLSILEILCLNVLALALALGLATAGPQVIHTTALTLNNCGTTSTHSNCTITTTELPLFHLLKIGLDEGSLLALNGKKFFECKIFFIEVECEYDETGLLFKVQGPQASGTTNGDLHAQQTPANLHSGGELCPEESELDFLLLPLPTGGPGNHYEGPIYITE